MTPQLPSTVLADSWYNRDIFKPYPELLVFLAIASGFLLGKVHYKSIAVGSVTAAWSVDPVHRPAPAPLRRQGNPLR